MVMKASLQLKMGQQLTMTPQLQQAIRLLQLSTLDLQQEIQEALESNPMLELAEEDTGKNSNNSSDENENRFDQKSSTSENTDNDSPTAEDQWSDTIPQDLPVDTAWDDIYPNQSSSGSYSDEDMDFESKNSVDETLQEHLIWQLNLTQMSDLDRYIASMLIDSISNDGYLQTTTEEIADSINSSLAHFDAESSLPENRVDVDEVEAVLKVIQNFDPPGIAGRDLQECLLIQLRQLPEDTKWLPQAKLLVKHYLNLLGNRDYPQLIRRSRIKENDLKEVIQLIQSLNPRPGEGISTSSVEYIVPDVFVKKEKGRWRVELNPDIAPKIRVNASYTSLIRRADSSSDNTFLKDQLQEAKWFIKSLLSRNETLLKVATRIVEHQQNFLEYGEEAMKPLVLHEIAEAVDMHESTISRVTTQKYMHTPRGIFELKYFFSSHVSTSSGGECSSTAIRAIIKKLIAAEPPKKPLSDSKLADILDEQGIKVARRTIAKYREAMSIPPSNERKRLV
jgi:RNA polymerase sigma-54 factor